MHSRGVDVDGVGIISSSDVVYALVTRYLRVALSHGSTPRSRRSHIHAHGVYDVVVAGEARLLGIWLLGDHGIVVIATLTHTTYGGPELRQLLLEPFMVFLIQRFIGESLLQDLYQPLLKALQIFPVQLVGELLPDLLEPHAEVSAGML